jgi:hypothetical protein
MHKTTMGEQGQKLPVGVREGRSIHRDFSLRAYKSYIDRHMGDWDETAEGRYTSRAAKIAARIPKLLSLLCESFGGVAMPLDDKRNSTAESELKFWSFSYADVMYAYIYARIASLGPLIEVPFTCGKCKKSQRAVFDLNTLELDVLDDDDEYERTVKLADPFKLRDGKLVRALRVHPVPWSAAMEPGVFSGQMHQISFAAIAGSISGVDCVEGPYQMTPQEMDEISRRDTININRRAGTLAAGIDLETTLECPCGVKHTSGLNWTFDYFFGSSLPMSETVNS